MRQPSKANIFEIIESSSVFRELSEYNRSLLSKYASLKSFRKNEPIWQKKSKAEYCFFLLAGMAEIIQRNKKGEENIQGIFGPGEIIGLPHTLRNMPYGEEAIAVSKSCEALQISLAPLKNDIGGSDLLNFLMWKNKQLLMHEQILRNKLLVLGAGSLHDRIIELLEQLILRFSKENIERCENFHIPVCLSKTQVAKMIEARVETVIRTLRKWEEAGFLKLTPEGVFLKKWSKLKDFKAY